MKIENGHTQLDAAQLIEQMQKAHTEGKEQTQGSSFAVGGAEQAAPAEAASELERSVMQIAQRVLEGDLTEPASARREVIDAIVDERYGALVEPSQRRRTVEMLEVTLGEDPTFAREVDNMLILAAQELASR